LSSTASIILKLLTAEEKIIKILKNIGVLFTTSVEARLKYRGRLKNRPESVKDIYKADHQKGRR
jgi:hypothetical protein